MATQPKGPGSEIDEETRSILDERLKTIDEDERNSVDAGEALAEIGRNLKRPRPQ